MFSVSNVSRKMNSDIQSLFIGIDGLCRKYSKEVTRIAQFQEIHRRRLLSYYRGKITKLEGYLKKATQQMQHIQWQHLRSLQETTRLPDSISEKTSISIPSEKQNGYSFYSLHSTRPSTSETVLSMEVDHVPPSVRKSETMAGPTRLSLISPPQNGHMGNVSCRSSQLSGMTLCPNNTSGSIRSSPLRIPNNGLSHMSPVGSSQNSRIRISDTFGLRTTQHHRCTPPSSHSVTRHPISLSSLLQRQHLGSTSLTGQSIKK
ncbi:probable E3 SUMO-protein ligase RNF212 isoform X2 [Hemicordylus capensis]|uniref:probable E3 SUMO-protein ligase RNF212 isoform X2 n=1 Tax=Hemicordylus capensis TaxID=884348 RepID=UPI00230299A6|nr:probable E3 SUMO-protein ligase RNF212 isoform X2 [Hemicordylus capensis]